MNTTATALATNHPGRGSGIGHEFTQGNLILLFLVIFVCLFTQPWGSLLYRPVGGDWPRYVRIPFFVWRFNPFACIAEAVIIAICYVDTLLQVRRQFLGSKTGKPTWSDLTHALHTTSIALLLLRSSNGVGGEVEVVLEERLASVPLPLPDDTTTPESSYLDKELEIDSLLSDHRAQENEKSETETETSFTNLRRRGTSQLEAATTTTGITSPDGTYSYPKPHSSQVAILETLLTRNTPTLFQSSRYLETMTTIVALATTLLLLTTSFPWPFRLIAAFHLLGWFAVKSLLIVFHHHPLSSSAPPGAIISSARRTRHILSQPMTYILLHLATIPFLARISYHIGWAFFFGYIDNEPSWITDAFPDWRIPHFPGVTIPGGIENIEDGVFPILIAIIRCALGLPIGMVVGYIASGICLGLYLLIPYSLSYILFFRRGGKEGWGILTAVVAGILQSWALLGLAATPQANLCTLYVIALSIAVGTGTVIWLAAAAPYRFRRVVPGAENKYIPGEEIAAFWVCLSTGVWVYLFEYGVQYYDPTGSLKPRWLEYWG